MYWELAKWKRDLLAGCFFCCFWFQTCVYLSWDVPIAIPIDSFSQHFILIICNHFMWKYICRVVYLFGSFIIFFVVVVVVIVFSFSWYLNFSCSFRALITSPKLWINSSNKFFHPKDATTVFFYISFNPSLKKLLFAKTTLYIHFMDGVIV